MKITEQTSNGIKIAVIVAEAGEKVITDTQTALHLMMTVQYEAGTNRIVLDKKAVADGFFVLSTGVAGEILQKYINYGAKLAIYGDYSGYTSKPLRDFIYESNQGRDFFFVATLEEALEKLGAAR